MNHTASTDDDNFQTLQKVANAIQNAEYIFVVGAAGISATEGPNYYSKDDPIYLKHFQAFEDKYKAGSICNNYNLIKATGRNWESRESY